MNQPSSTLSSVGKRGQVLTFDAALATVLVVIVIAASAHYASVSAIEPAAVLQMVRTGHDVIAVLDAQGFFNRANVTELENELQNSTPVNYNIRLSVENETTSWYVTNSSLPNETLTVSGIRPVVLRDTNFSIVRFWIWPE